MNLNDHEVTESTPLLSGGVEQTAQSASIGLPPIRPTLQQILSRERDLEEATPQYVFPSIEAKTAFHLILLLLCYEEKKTKPPSSLDLWQQWHSEADHSHELDELERSMMVVWNGYLQTYRSPAQVEQVLWFGFPEKFGSLRRVRVIDCLTSSNAPIKMISHRVCVLSLMRTWKYGLSEQEPLDSVPTPSVSRVLRAYDKLSTPRALHLLDLFVQLLYISTLAHYLLYPQPALDGRDWRAFWLILYATSQFIYSWSLHLVPYGLLLVGFLPPLAVGNVSMALSTLHLAFAIHLFGLHLPYLPSPVFLFPRQLLPLSTFLAHISSEVYIPVLLFFSPVILVTAILLCLSIADPLSYTVQFMRSESPMATREFFLTLLILEVLLLLFSFLTVATALLRQPTSKEARLQEDDAPEQSHSRTPFAHGFHTALVHAVARYTNAEHNYVFPPPFIVVQRIFIWLPTRVLRDQRNLERVLSVMEKVLWRLAVGPFGMLTAGISGFALRS